MEANLSVCGAGNLKDFRLQEALRLLSKKTSRMPCEFQNELQKYDGIHKDCI